MRFVHFVRVYSRETEGMCDARAVLGVQGRYLIYLDALLFVLSMKNSSLTGKSSTLTKFMLNACK